MRIIYLLGTFPSASEYFILHELLSLQRRGVHIQILAMERPAGGSPDTAQPAGAAGNVIYYRSFAALPAHLYCIATRLRPYMKQVRKLLAALSAGSSNKAGQLKYFHAGIWFAYRLRKEKARHIHAHFASMPAAVAAVTAAVSGRTYSISAHAQDIYTQDKLLEEKINTAAFTATCTRYNHEYLLRRFPGRPVYHIYHGLGIAGWPFLRRTMPEAPHPIRILAIARLVEKKGLIYLLQALALLQQQIPVACTIVGEGPEREQLMAAARQAGMEDHIRFAGALPQEALPALYASHHVFILPCIIAGNGDRDGLPNVLLEALASGLPAITTGVSAIPELIRHKESGMLVPDKDAAAIAAAVLSLQQDPALYAHIAERGRRIVSEHFDIETCTDRLYDLFRDKAAI